MIAISPVNKFDKLSSIWMVLAAIALAVAANGYVFSIGPYAEVKEVSDANLPEETFFGDGTETNKWLETIGEDGRKKYATFQYVDFVTAFLNFLAMTAIVAFVMRFATEPGSGVRHLLWFGPIGYAVDFTENVFLLMAKSGFDDPASGAADLAAKITTAKFGCVLILALTLFITLFVAIRKKILRRSTKVGGNKWNN